MPHAEHGEPELGRWLGRGAGGRLLVTNTAAEGVWSCREPERRGKCAADALRQALHNITGGKCVGVCVALPCSFGSWRWLTTNAVGVTPEHPTPSANPKRHASGHAALTMPWLWRLPGVGCAAAVG